MLTNGFDVVYQPIVSLAGDRLLGYEALSRFPDDTPTQHWFEQAWAVGLGAELELAAIHRAVEGLPHFPPDAYLAVNVSPETLLSRGFADAFGDAPADRIVLEITEHAHVFDYEPVTAALDKLRGDGFRIAMDDLGTGHAGINHLLQFQPDVFKIDLGVVQGIRRDPLRRAIAATFATLAVSIGASIVAEGIEKAEDRDALEVLGLTAGQGFHISRPVPVAALVQGRAGGAG